MMQSVKHIFFKKLPWKEFFLIVVAAFAGNSLTSLYQERLWERQNNDSRRISEITVATRTFEELSSTIDRRIYRMDKLDRWMHDNSDQKMIHRQMKEYRDILYEWNDSYNKNKAKVRLYFGDDIADRFDYIHYFFKETGKSLEDQYYIDPSNRNLDTLGTIGDRVGDLNNIALEINEGMIAKIQKQEVGVFLDASSQDTNKLSLRYNNSPSIINIFGLLFDILGGILLFRYGLPEDVRRNGESYLLLESMDENEMYKAKKYNFYGKIGIASIFLGFVLQLMSNFLW